MTRTFMEETGLSTFGEICALSVKSSSALGLGQEGRTAPKPRLSPVRDYKDRFILRLLQTEARQENPGFLYLKPEEKAKLVWVESGEGRMPVGYYVYWEARSMFSKYDHGYVQLPAAFSQVYVVPEMRRQGIATRMLQDFIAHAPSGALWVESPKHETVALLHKLGYHEPDEKYELWQMMEGLSRWVLADELVLKRSELSRECPEAWVWAGDAGVGISSLR